MKVCSVDGCGKVVKAKTLCRKHYLTFWRNGDPLLLKRGANGSGFMQEGYKAFRINGKVKLEHVLIVEAVIGHELPKGAQVHHIDGNRLNNSNSNLLVCQSDSYHKLIHVRTQAYEASGNANNRKCTICKKYDSLENLKKNNSSFRHNSCAVENNKKYFKRRT